MDPNKCDDCGTEMAVLTRVAIWRLCDVCHVPFLIIGWASLQTTTVDQ